MREICLDTETTGMAAKEGDRIIEIGCVELGEHGLTDKNFHEYIDPERQMEAEVIRVHKITNEFLVGKPKFADIADKFIEFVQGARLIIHNAQFDIGFLNEELRKLGKPSMEEICGKDNIIDSMELAKAAFPQMHNSLDALCKRLEIDTTRRVKEGHGALLDAELLGQVYLVLKQQQGILEIDAAPVSADVHDISDVEPRKRISLKTNVSWKWCEKLPKVPRFTIWMKKPLTPNARKSRTRSMQRKLSCRIC